MPQPVPGTGPFAARQSAPLNGAGMLTRPMTGPLQGGSPKVNSTRTAQSKAASDDPVRKMKQLKEMLDAGLITEADFQQKKLDILSRI